MSKLFRLILVVICLAGVLPTKATFKDIRLDLTNGAFLTEDEISSKTTVSFGVAISDDGTQTRVAADDATASIVLSGKYHSNEHGWGNFSATVVVDGPVKISMGSCAWGGDVTVKDAAGSAVGSFNTNNGACYHNDKENNVVSCYYKGTEPGTTLTISGGNYTPYLAVEAADPSIVPSDIKVTYQLGDIEAEGTAPAEDKVEAGSKYTIPGNYTLYAEGKTLTGWTDGTNTYKPREEITVGNEDMTLTAVFTDNTVALNDRNEAVTVNFDFQRQNGAPTVGYERVTGIWVTQAVVNGETIDVKLDFDTNNGGKIANANWSDWAQMNNGTKLTVPSCKGATVSLNAYGTITSTTIDGQSDYAQGTSISYTIASSAERIDIVIGDGSYYRNVQIVMPVVSTTGGSSYTNEPASVVWKFNSTENYNTVSSVTPDNGFAMTSVNTGDIEVTGTGTGQAVDAEGNAVTFVKLKPSGSTTAVEWFVKPAAGLTFTPTRVSAYIQRFGTDAENGVTVTAKLADGTTETLGNFTAPRNNKTQDEDKYGSNGNYTNQFVIELTAEQQEKLTSTDGFYLYASVGVGSAKEGGFSDVHIDGLLNGTIAEVAKYTLMAKAAPENGGTVSVYPKADEYDEGSEVQLTATKNFGYYFVNWTDAEGNVISEDAKFTYTVESDIELTANFAALNTYELAYSVEGGANLYMVSAQPAPTVIDGKNMYEAGTRVTLTASSNPILTFTNWSNGETNAEIALDMNEDIELTAFYDAVDFVAGWDFEQKGAEGRKADFYSTDNDVAQLIMRNADGETSGWLDKSNEAAGGYEGRPGAVNWRTTGLGEYYWQTVLNCSAFTDLTVTTAMVYNYNAYQTYNVEYSLDGENWTVAGQINMPGAKKWTDAEIVLPAECNNQETVYLRWIADKESNIDGTTSSNDGACLGATWILGTENSILDPIAPTLLQSVPAEGADNASANGRIVLTFDKKVKVADGTTATLGNKTLTPAVSGKTVVFDYKGLEYSTDYTFTLPGNSVANLSDSYMTEAITINFTTKPHPEVTKSLYSFIVPDNGTFNDAISAANNREDKSKRFYIFIKDGSYKATNTEGATVVGSDGNTYPSETTNLTSSNVSIIGESMDGTVVYNEPTNVIEGLDKATTLCIQNNVLNTYLQDFTLTHTLGDNGRVAVLQDRGNKTICKTMKLDGFQDTYYSNMNSSRFYFETSSLGGRVDFLCGGGDVVYNQCDLVVKAAGCKITAAGTPLKHGYVFLDCTIKGEKNLDGQFTLGRPWSQGASTVQYVNTTMEIQPSAAGWEEMSGGWPAVFKEYNSHTANGTAVSLADRKIVFGDGHEVDTRTPLTAAEVAELTIENVMGGNDDWDPTAATEQVSAPTNVVIENGSTITWDNSNYVLLWAICKNGKVVDFTIENSYMIDEPNATWSVRAANEMGGLGEATTASIANAISTVDNTRKAVVNTEYYNLQGIKVSKSFNGTVIKIETLEDGSKTITKMNK